MSVGLDATSYYTRSTNLPTITSFTMMAWVYYTNLTGYKGWASLGSDSTYFYMNGSYADGLNFVWNGDIEATNSTQISLSTWYHCAITVSGTGAGNFLDYFDTVLDITHAGNSSISSGMMHIGHSYGNDPLQGRICAVKIWNRVLTQAQIAAERYYGYAVDDSSINGVYKLRVPETTDYSGNGYSLTTVGTGHTTQTDPIGITWDEPEPPSDLFWVVSA